MTSTDETVVPLANRHPIFSPFASHPGTVILKVEATEFYVHKDMLTFASSFFECLLNGGWRETLSETSTWPGDKEVNLPENRFDKSQKETWHSISRPFDEDNNILKESSSTESGGLDSSNLVKSPIVVPESARLSAKGDESMSDDEILLPRSNEEETRGDPLAVIPVQASATSKNRGRSHMEPRPETLARILFQIKSTDRRTNHC